jgi:two-component system LytT family response regulator
MIRTIIVEDEEPNINTLTTYLNQDYPDVKVVAICRTISESVEKISSLKPDLVFLDVRMDNDDEGGIRVLEKTRDVKYEVVFATAHAQYALKAFQFSALDYLLKPFESKDVGEALNRYKNERDQATLDKIGTFLYNQNEQDITLHRVAVASTDGMLFIPVSEIIMCSADNNCTNFHITQNFANQIQNLNRKVLATKTLKHYEEMLQDYNFCRPHKSYLINMRHIIRYKKGSDSANESDGKKGGEGGLITLSENHQADVSRDKKDAFKDCMQTLGIQL